MHDSMLLHLIMRASFSDTSHPTGCDVLSTVYRPGSKLRVLDLCTGSGVQGINAALHAREAVSASPECLSPSFEITLHAESRTFGVTGD